MRFLKRLIFVPILTAAALLGPRLALADVINYDADMVNNPSIAYSTTIVLDVSGMDSLAMQAVYSSTTLSAFSLIDGRKSTGTITVVSTSSLTSARIAVNGCVLDQGSEWTAVSTASGTAKAISDAIVANNCLTGVVVSTWASGVVYTTASAIGTAGNSITLFSNTSSITVSGATLSNGAASNFATATDDVTLTAATGMSTGTPLLFVTVTGTIPTGLTTATTYYAIVTANNKFKFASSSANALAGTAIDITALTGSGTFTATLTAMAGTPSFKWQSSNDNANWVDLSVSSVTFATPYTASTAMWDGSINYKYLRLNYVAGTGGGVNLRCLGFGKRRYP